MKKITVIREQGAAPRTDTFSFNRYVCDLCKGVNERTEIIQCPFCGRWICREKCLEQEQLVCLNCAGIIKIVKQSEDMNIESEKMKIIEKTMFKDKNIYKKKNTIDNKMIKEKDKLYLCEICKNSFPISGLIQCSGCRKWICKDNCIDTKENICLICASK